MIRITYSSMVVKQGYRKDSTGKQIPYFNEDMIDVKVSKELYAEDKTIAYSLIEKWNKDPYFSYEIIEVENVSDSSIPPDTYIHYNVYCGVYNS